MGLSTSRATQHACAGDTGMEGTDGTASWRVLTATDTGVLGVHLQGSPGGQRGAVQGPRDPRRGAVEAGISHGPAMPRHRLCSSRQDGAGAVMSRRDLLALN